MKKRIAWLLMSCLVALSLVLASCAQPAPTMPTPPTAPTPPVESGRVWLDEYTYVAGGDGEPIVLINNPSASNPTWEQLFSFLQDDETDAYPYGTLLPVIGTEGQVCADFAEALHNNAEAVGIRTAFVVLPENDHALNAFETTDEGLVYIDCTGEAPRTSFTPIPAGPAGAKTFGDVSSWDKVAYVKVGEPLGFISLEVAHSYGFQYSSYEQWIRDKASFDSLADKYERQRGGRLFVPEADYDQLMGKLKDLEKLANKLGGFWEQGDIVKEIKIIWEGE